MITAHQLKKAQRTIEEAIEIASSEMPNATFVLVGLDTEKVYFNVVCKLSQTNEQEMKDIIEKTRFECLSEDTRAIYKGEFAINHTLILNGKEAY